MPDLGNPVLIEFGTQSDSAVKRSLHAAGPALALVLLTFATGCRLDIVRVREGNPIPQTAFDQLTTGLSTREEMLESMGAPDRLEWKNGEDHIWYDYEDEVDVGIRFRLPFSAFGYQHTFLRVSDNSMTLNTARLVFNEDALLTEKSLRVGEAYTPESSEKSGRVQLSSRFERSVFLRGDAGVDDYDEVFEQGFRAGVDLSYQPVPVCTFLFGGSYQEYQGETILEGGQTINFDDLNLFQVEIGVRLSVPFALLSNLGDSEEIKRILFDENIDNTRGFLFYLQGTTGGTINSNVPVRIDGVRSGNFYDNALLFSGTVGGGVEYHWLWGSLRLGASYATLDPFDKGNSPVDDDATAFQSLLVGGEFSLNF